MLEHVKITGFTHCRNAIKAAMKIVGEEVGMKKSNANKKKEPFLKRRILANISRLWKDLSRIEAWFSGKMEKGQEKIERKVRSKVWSENKRDYIGNGRTETENNCKSH